MARKPFQASRPELVPAQGFEPWTIGLKARPDLRGTPPQGPLRIGFSAPRLSVAPRVSAAWLCVSALKMGPNQRTT